MLVLLRLFLGNIGNTRTFSYNVSALTGGLYFCTKELNSFGTFDIGLYSVDWMLTYAAQASQFSFNNSGSIRKVIAISGTTNESYNPKKLFSYNNELYLLTGVTEKTGSVYFESNHWTVVKFPGIIYSSTFYSGTQPGGLTGPFGFNYSIPKVSQYSIQESINYDFREQGTFKDYILPWATYSNEAKGYYLVGRNCFG